MTEPPIAWSVFVAPVGGGDDPWQQSDPDAVLRSASVGKLVLLGELARALDAGEIDPAERVRYLDDEFVRDSGLWHALRHQPDLAIEDAAVLVGAVSDNLATNVLLRRLGLPAVTRFGAELSLPPLELLDRIRRGGRDPRRPGVAETLSRTSGRAAWRYLQLLATERISPRVADWLSFDTDLSMVASAFLADPLAHSRFEDHQPRLLNKTGTDDGIRADVGLIDDGARQVAYAAIANWDPSVDALPTVMRRMREIGEDIRRRLAG